MSEPWTDDWLRGVAGWKAFKEGKSLADQGMASSLLKSNGCTGSVREGGKIRKVSVTVKSANEVIVHCACPENRATGAICAHAVAVLLHSKQKPARDKPSAPAGMAPPIQEAAVVGKAVSPRAWSVFLPPDWVARACRGSLAVLLQPAADQEIQPADRELCAWLHSLNIGSSQGAVPLQLQPGQTAEFLRAIQGHPRLHCGTGAKNRALSIQPFSRPVPVEVEAQGENVRIRKSSAIGQVFEISGTWWWSSASGEICRVSSGVPDEEVAQVALKACQNDRSASFPLRRFIGQAAKLQDWLEFPAESFLAGLLFQTAPVTIGLLLHGHLQRLDASLFARYPDLGKSADKLPISPHTKTPPEADDQTGFPIAPKEGGGAWLVRNEPAEQCALRRLLALGFSPHGSHLTLQGEDAVLDFLANDLAEISSKWQVEQDPGVRKAASQIQIIQPSMEFQGGGHDWLSFDLSFQTNDGNELSRQDVQQILRSGKRHGRLPNGRRSVVSRNYAEVIEPLLQEVDPMLEGGHWVANPASKPLLQEIHNNIRKSLGLGELQDSKTIQSEDILPPGFPARLRDYQLHGVAWLMDRWGQYGGALLADEMGLGKTIQTIAAIESLKRNSSLIGPVLVACPTSVLGNWEMELAKFAPGRRVLRLHGKDRDQAWQAWENADYIVTSFETLSRDLALHLKREYGVLVVDEASLLRNPDTDQAKAATKVRAKYRVALTGTPLENSVRDLWSVFRIIAPGYLGSREEFRQRYELPSAAKPAAPGCLERLRLRIRPFVMRRTKDEVAKDLPPKIQIEEWLTLSTEQERVYRSILKHGAEMVRETRKTGGSGAARMKLLTTLLRLRQCCCDLALLDEMRYQEQSLGVRSAKMERLFELLDEAVSEGRKVLVFSQFRKQLLEIYKQATGRGLEVLMLDGQTRNRDELVKRFQSDDGPSVFLVSLKAGGYGLNLTAADVVVHFDPWWNPAAEAQAIDRAHRIGQTRPVTVYRLLTRNTVEEKVRRLQEHKRMLGAGVFDESGDDDPGSLNMDQLEHLITEA
jgi:superfamily II DNA or RNA helicase